jgi:hypothetical protein
MANRDFAERSALLHFVPSSDAGVNRKIVFARKDAEALRVVEMSVSR